MDRFDRDRSLAAGDDHPHLADLEHRARIALPVHDRARTVEPDLTGAHGAPGTGFWIEGVDGTRDLRSGVPEVDSRLCPVDLWREHYQRFVLRRFVDAAAVEHPYRVDDRLRAHLGESFGEFARGLSVVDWRAQGEEHGSRVECED